MTSLWQTWTNCSSAVFSSRCSPWDRPVMPNDTCLQAIDWGRLQHRSTAIDIANVTCPAPVTGNPNLPYYNAHATVPNYDVASSGTLTTPPLGGGDP